MRKSLKLVILALLSLLISLLAFTWLTYLADDNVTASACAKIKPGMTLIEVETVLGGPSNSRWQLPPDGPGEECYLPAWSGKIGRIGIVFDSSNKVVNAKFAPWAFGGNEHPTFVERLWARFGL